ncbi:hypothetical protein GCM10027563_40290 [Parasphingorhabdus pacifica]
MAEDFGLGRSALTRTRAALAAPPWPVVRSLGAVSSRSHITITAPSGRSCVMREQMIRVTATVITTAHAVEKKLKPMFIRRSNASTSRKTTSPTPQAT